MGLRLPLALSRAATIAILFFASGFIRLQTPSAEAKDLATELREAQQEREREIEAARQERNTPECSGKIKTIVDAIGAKYERESSMRVMYNLRGGQITFGCDSKGDKFTVVSMDWTLMPEHRVTRQALIALMAKAGSVITGDTEKQVSNLFTRCFKKLPERSDTNYQTVGGTTTANCFTNSIGVLSAAVYTRNEGDEEH